MFHREIHSFFKVTERFLNRLLIWLCLRIKPVWLNLWWSSNANTVLMLTALSLVNLVQAAAVSQWATKSSIKFFICENHVKENISCRKVSVSGGERKKTGLSNNSNIITACGQTKMTYPYTEHAVTLYLQVARGEKMFSPALQREEITIWLK